MYAPCVVIHSSPHHQLRLGAPRSQKRTWVNQGGAKPDQSSVFFSFPSPPMLGCPILRALGEGWDKQNLRGRPSGEEPWYPTLRQEREGWGTRALGFADGVFLLRKARTWILFHPRAGNSGISPFLGEIWEDQPLRPRTLPSAAVKRLTSRAAPATGSGTWS